MGAIYDWSKDSYLTQDEIRTITIPPCPRPVREPPVRPRREPVRMSSVPAAPRKRTAHRRQQRRKKRRIAAVLLCALILFFWKPWSSKSSAATPLEDIQSLEQSLPLGLIEPSLHEEEKEIVVPDWVVQKLLPINEYSRPGTPLAQVNGVVVHYVGNPGTTAEQNRSYYASLAETHETWASSHFVIDTDGTVIQCVPLNEIAYCSNDRNNDTISIECCHLDSSGKFTEETLDSLTQLLNWLIDTYSLEREDILRHYDVTGKECPKYFVKNPDVWESFLDKLIFPS